MHRHFYIFNAILNWNAVFLLALLAPVVLLLRVLVVKLGGQPLPSLGQGSGWLAFPIQPLLYQLPLHLWLAIMSATPHKEERFLFPVYPLIALSAAFLLESELVDLAWAFGTRWAYRLVHLLLLLTSNHPPSPQALLSISRITSLHLNYRAPLTMYHYLSEFELRRLPDHEPAQVRPASPARSTSAWARSGTASPLTTSCPRSALSSTSLSQALTASCRSPSAQRGHTFSRLASMT